MPATDARARVPAETRRLLTAAVLAVAALWLLARWRFPDRPVGPVSTVFTQITAPSGFADLSGEADDLHRRLSPRLEALAAPTASGELRLTPAWSLGERSVAVFPEGPPPGALGWDPPTGLATMPSASPLESIVETWRPDRTSQPRYLFLVMPGSGAFTVTPVYCGRLDPVASVAWPGEVWLVPPATVDARLAEGALVFTRAAELVGVVSVADGHPAIVPADVVATLAGRLTPGVDPAPDLGVRVQPLTPVLATATGADTGVVVAGLADGGPLQTALRLGDVVTALNGEPVPSVSAWRVRSARLRPGAGVILSVRRDGAARDVAFEVPRPAVPVEASALGLELDVAPGQGARVTAVRPGSAASRAGLQAGDVLTHMGGLDAPTPPRVQAAWEGLAVGRALLLAVSRGRDTFVTALAR